MARAGGPRSKGDSRPGSPGCGDCPFHMVKTRPGAPTSGLVSPATAMSLPRNSCDSASSTACPHGALATRRLARSPRFEDEIRRSGCNPYVGRDGYRLTPPGTPMGAQLARSDRPSYLADDWHLRLALRRANLRPLFWLPSFDLVHQSENSAWLCLTFAPALAPLAGRRAC